MVSMPICTSFLQGMFQTISVFSCMHLFSFFLAFLHPRHEIAISLQPRGGQWGALSLLTHFKRRHTCTNDTHVQVLHCTDKKDCDTLLPGVPEGQRRNKPHSHTPKMTERPFPIISHRQFSSVWFCFAQIGCVLYSSCKCSCSCIQRVDLAWTKVIVSCTCVCF